MSQTHSGYEVDRSTALYERPAVVIGDTTTFAAVTAAVEGKFAAGNVEGFMKSLERAKLRIRDFEAVAKAGKLGTAAASGYAKLPMGDQALVREMYLASLEQVEPGLRDKYFRLYAYY